MTRPTTAAARPWSLNRQAAKAVALNARDVDDARLLLDMLGLVDGPEGREITPDDRRALDLSLLAACPGGPPPATASRSNAPATTPPGLASLTAAPALPVETAVPDPDAVVEPLPRRRGRPPVPIEHGSEKGYQQHKRKKTPIPADDACGCQAAHDATLKRPAVTGQAPEPEPAEPVASGVAAPAADDGLMSLHVEESLSIDELLASPATPALLAPRRAPAPAPAPIEHGTPAGWQAHYDRGALPPCDDCDLAVGNLHVTDAQEQPEAQMPAASVAIGRDLADWLSEASTSPAAAVRRSASATLRLLEELLDALDELARAERSAARTASGAA